MRVSYSRGMLNSVIFAPPVSSHSAAVSIVIWGQGSGTAVLSVITKGDGHIFFYLLKNYIYFFFAKNYLWVMWEV